MSFKFGYGYGNSHHYTVPNNLFAEILAAKYAITSCGNNGKCRMNIEGTEDIDLKQRVSIISKYKVFGEKKWS